MTEIDVYQPAAVEPYRAALAMTPEAAKALDDQLRQCTKAVLREGTDYGVIPGTSDRKVLLKPGAEKLLQWFGFGFTCDRLDLEVDADGQKAGVTYRCTVTKRLADGAVTAVTTCEGYAGYDEDRFYQSAEQAQHKAEAKERYWAAKDRRVANPEKWKHAVEYRAPWNTVIKMAQKRAIVGATIDATAAAGLFGQDEDDDSPVTADGELSWYTQALEAALTFTTVKDGSELYTQAGQAARDGLCTRAQKDHVQNRVRQRLDRLRNARPVDVEDLGRQAEPDPTTSGASSSADADQSPRKSASSSPASPASSGGEPDETDYDTPGTLTTPQITAIWTILSSVYKFGPDERDQARKVCSHIIERELASSKDMSKNEAGAVIDTLASWQERAQENEMEPRAFLIELLAKTAEPGDEGGSDA